jgi:hypothetical protein
MKKAYYSIVVRFDEFDTFSVQFGDYDREVVEEECEEYSGNCYQVKIIKTEAGQAAIMAKVAELNSKLEV